MTYERKCIECGETKAVGEFFCSFDARRQNHRFHKRCRECHGEATMASRRKGRQKDGLTYVQLKRRESFLHPRHERFDGSWLEYVAAHCLAARLPEPAATDTPRRIRWALTLDQRRKREADEYRERYRSDPEFAIRERLRRQARKHGVWGDIQSRIRESVKRPTPQGGALFEFLGYTPFELKRHLEQQFVGGMGWDAFRRGEIHIDHKRPVASFDLSTDEDIRACWSLSNMQPLWAQDNMQKGARRSHG